MKTYLPLAAVAAGVLLLSGCVVAPAPHPYGPYGSGGPAIGATVQVAPPPPRQEYMGAPPVNGYVWISGYWNWIGVRYDWVPGRWMAPPRPGTVWVPHVWQREGEGWRARGGHWDDDRDQDRRRGGWGRGDRGQDRDGDGRPDWRERR